MGLNFKVNLCKRNTKHNYTGLEEQKKKRVLSDVQL